MYQAHLNMKPDNETTECWDRLSLTIKGSDNVIPLIIFKNRSHAIEAYTQLFGERYSDPEEEFVEGPFDLKLAGETYHMEYEAWILALQVLDDWFDDYVGCGQFEIDNPTPPIMDADRLPEEAQLDLEAWFEDDKT